MPSCAKRGKDDGRTIQVRFGLFTLWRRRSKDVESGHSSSFGQQSALCQPSLISLIQLDEDHRLAKTGRTTDHRQRPPKMSRPDPTPALFSQLSISHSPSSISLTNHPRPHPHGRPLIQSDSVNSGMSLETLEDEEMPGSCGSTGRGPNGVNRVKDEEQESDGDEGQVDRERNGRKTNGFRRHTPSKGIVHGKCPPPFSSSSPPCTFLTPTFPFPSPSLYTVEVRLNPSQRLQTPQIRSIVRQYIQENFERAEPGAEVEGWRDVGVLRGCAERIVFAESSEFEGLGLSVWRLSMCRYTSFRGSGMALTYLFLPVLCVALANPFPLLSEVKLVIHVYQPSNHAGLQEFAATTGGELFKSLIGYVDTC